MPIQPLHNPSLAAQVIVSQALIDNGSIAPLAKKGNRGDVGDRTSNLAFCSPTDNLLTPCTRKLNARTKHFKKPSKTVQLFRQAKDNESIEEESVSDSSEQVATGKKMEDDGENPF